MPRFLILSGTNSFAFVAAALLASSSLAKDWPEFRGPTGQGHADSTKLPIKWSATENVAWKVDVPGKGWSSPVLVKDRIYLTSAVPVPDNAAGDYTLNVLCLRADTGATVWDTVAFNQSKGDDANIHGKNSHASPTAIVDGNRIYAHFGHQGMACLDLDGKIIWKNNEFRYPPVHGNGGSPALVGNAIVFSCDGANQQVVMALDRDSGKELWRNDRQNDAPKKFSFSTPLVIDVDGQQQIISPGSNAVCAYDPADGHEIWRVKYDGYSVIPRPVFGHGLIFISTAYDSPKAMAIRPAGAKGDVTDTHVAWVVDKGAPNTPSLLLIEDRLYMLSDKGVFTCLDAKTGEQKWQQRIGGNFSASPLFADGKIYLQSEEGEGTVVGIGDEYEELGRNPIEDRSLASYAVDDGALFIRTEKHLYRIGTR